MPEILNQFQEQKVEGPFDRLEISFQSETIVKRILFFVHFSRLYVVYYTLFFNILEQDSK